MKRFIAWRDPAAAASSAHRRSIRQNRGTTRPSTTAATALPSARRPAVRPGNTTPLPCPSGRCTPPLPTHATYTQGVNCSADTTRSNIAVKRTAILTAAALARGCHPESLPVSTPSRLTHLQCITRVIGTRSVSCGVRVVASLTHEWQQTRPDINDAPSAQRVPTSCRAASLLSHTPPPPPHAQSSRTLQWLRQNVAWSTAEAHTAPASPCTTSLRPPPLLECQ